MSRGEREKASPNDTTLTGSGAAQAAPAPFTRQDAWDEFARRAGGGLLQSFHWGEFKRASGWTPARVRLQAGPPGSSLGAQVLFRSMPRLPFPLSIAYIPRGPLHLGGSLDPAADRPFWKSVHAFARKRGAIFLKVEPPVELLDEPSRARLDRKMSQLGFRPSGRLQPARTIVLDLGGSEESILKAMKPKTRYNIRLAGRRNVQVRRAETIGDLRAFYSILQVTGQRDEFGIHTFDYYEQMWKVFGPEGTNSALVLLAEHPDEQERRKGPIAGLVALRFGREAIYMYGSSANHGREHMPTYLLQWEAIRWARENGCEVYDFWGIPDAPTDSEDETELSPVNTRAGLRGVYWFKKGFGGREVTYPGAYDYVYNPLLYKLWMRWRGANLG